MKILLVNPPEELDIFLGRGKNFIPLFEPLGLLYISAVCRKKGYETYVLDAFAEKLSCEQVKSRIAQIDPDLVGFTSFTCSGNTIYKLGKWLKSEYPGKTVVFGNLHASVYAEAYLKNQCCDIVVHGEGEYTFLSIASAVENKISDFSHIHSISFMKDGHAVTTSEPSVVNDLSELPLPDRDSVRQELYNIPSISNIPYVAKKRGLGKHMFTSRGCLFSCAFCVNHYKKPRYNSVENVLDEMELLADKYRAAYIFISDPLFISSRQRVMDICDGIRKRGINVLWGCEAHVNCVDKALIESMESAGCHDIAFGIESGVQRLLDNVNKGTRIERIREAVDIVKKNTKVKVSGLFILGLPGETRSDSVKTIDFAKSLPLDMAQFSILVPYPGSEIFYNLKALGQIDTGVRDDWTINTSVWPRYTPYIFDTVSDPIWVTPELTAGTLKKMQKKALREFYFRPRHFCDQLKRVRISELGTILPTFLKTFF